MSTFRRYGGLNYSSTNNITRSFISNSDQMNINNFSGLENTKETFKSHIDLSGNSILHTQCIYFQDGSQMCTAGNIGSQGPPGATGAQGTGPQGDIGPAGPVGPQGFTGAQGTGPQGDQGPAGPQGFTGSAGATGSQGTGPQGDQGPAGPQGFTGSAGSAGAQGFTGSAGSQGDQGPAGPQGFTGSAGPQGFTGSAGSQGDQGPAGPQGFTGSQGDQGPAGPQGFTGSVGPVGPAATTTTIYNTSSTSVSIPSTVRVVEFILIGGGGGGANNGTNQWAGGSGAIGIYKYINAYTEALTISVIIGSGGISGTSGSNGQDTSISFTPLIGSAISVSAGGGIGGSSTGPAGAGGVVTPNNTYFIYSTSGAAGNFSFGVQNNIFPSYGGGASASVAVGASGVLVVTTYS